MRKLGILRKVTKLTSAASSSARVFRCVNCPLAAVLPFEDALGVAHNGIFPRIAVMGRELAESLGEHLRILFRVRDRDPLDFASHRLVVATMEGERRKDGTERIHADNPNPHVWVLGTFFKKLRKRVTISGSRLIQVS